MKLRLFPKITTMSVDFVHVQFCPLCGSKGPQHSTLTRQAYRFSTLSIPLPPESVNLIACQTCDLLYKDHVPTAEGLTNVMVRAAEDAWNAKSGLHPSLEQVLPFLQGGDIIDIGAAHGDLLLAVAPHTTRRSAFDVVVYERCRSAVTDEYVIGTFENIPSWSGKPYTVVTAYDVFEHFLNARLAVANVLAFLRQRGYLIIETGDWRSVGEPDRWYYCNLFEHQVFWSPKTIDYLCDTRSLERIKCQRVNHKGRRNVSITKRIAINAFRAGGFVLGPMTGIDAQLVPSAQPNDHLFAVLQKK